MRIAKGLDDFLFRVARRDRSGVYGCLMVILKNEREHLCGRARTKDVVDFMPWEQRNKKNGLYFHVSLVGFGITMTGVSVAESTSRVSYAEAKLTSTGRQGDDHPFENMQYVPRNTGAFSRNRERYIERRDRKVLVMLYWRA